MKMVSVSNLKRHMTTSPQWMISLSTLKKARYSVLGTQTEQENIYYQHDHRSVPVTAGEITVDGIDVRRQTKKPKLLWDSSQMKVIFTMRWTGLKIYVFVRRFMGCARRKESQRLTNF